MLGSKVALSEVPDSQIGAVTAVLNYFLWFEEIEGLLNF